MEPKWLIWARELQAMAQTGRTFAGDPYDRERYLRLRSFAAEIMAARSGGWADVNRSPSESVIREVAEEAGYRVEVRKLAAVYDRAKHPHEPPYPFHIYKMFFLCEIVGGAPTGGFETSGVDFFAEDALPELSRGRVLPFQIAAMFPHPRNPALPTYCD